MPDSHVFPFLALALLLFAGCAASGSSTDTNEPASINNVQDLVMHLGRQGFVLHPAGLVTPFALADVGYEYRVQGERLLIYEFASPEAAEDAVDDFLLDTSGGGQTSVFQHGSLMVSFAGRSTSLQFTLSNTLGPAVY